MLNWHRHLQHATMAKYDRVGCHMHETFLSEWIS